MATETKLLTAEEFWRAGDRYRWAELVHGEVREMTPTGGDHGVLAARITIALGPHAKRYGELLVETGFVLRAKPDTVRGPDIAFVRADRVPKEATEKFWPGAPDLAVEIVSPSDSAEEVQEKVQQYLETGARLVWVVYPRAQSVTVYRPDHAAVVLHADDVLDGGDVLPEFSLPLPDLFCKPGT